MKKKKKITKKKIIISIIVVIIAIFIFTNFNKNNQEDVTKVEIESIEKRTIAKSISAIGTINSSNTKNVVATLTGSEIKSVNVKKGDKVNVGDVICTFDTSSIQENLSIAQASQNTAQAQANLGVQSAQRNLNDAISNKDTQIASSQKDLNSAKSAYDDAVNQLNNINNTLNQKQNELKNYAQANAQSLNGYQTLKTDYETKKATYTQVSNELQTKNSELEYLKSLKQQNSEDSTIDSKISQLTIEVNAIQMNRDSAKSLLDNAETVYNQASGVQSQYNALTAEIAELQAQKAQLETSISQLKTTYDKMVTAHNSVISTSDSTIASMRDNLTNSQLAANSSSLASSSQINTLKDQIEDGIVKSTVAGTVTDINVKKGDLYTGTTIATIEGTEEFIIEAEIDEYDIPDVEVGMKVLIKTDATREEELEGRITYVASSATNNASAAGMTTTTTGTNATYKIEISLDSQNDRLRLGMNAKLSIITEMEEDVWSVPYNAIYEREDGTHYIEIAKDETGENKEELDVIKGIEGSYYAEIKSDKLKSDMKVILPKVEAGDSMKELLEMMGADAGM